MASFIWMLSAISTLVYVDSADQECRRLKFGPDKIVCVCDGHYCDSSEAKLPSPGQYLTITSNKDGLRFKKKYGFIEKHKEFNVYADSTKDLLKQKLFLKVNRTKKNQRMHGFGTSFTDSAGINTAKLTKNVQDILLSSCFNSSGLDYNMGRVPIAGTDFSTRGYTYDDVEDDTDLWFFELAEEDHKYKIPYILKANALSNVTLDLMASSWSPPLFMKNKHSFVGANHLKREHYPTYVQYIIKFLQEYQKEGIRFWAITPGNEPTDGLSSFINFTNTCGWLPDDMAKWIIHHFGPGMKNSEFKNIKILLPDDSRHAFLLFLKTMLKHKGIEKYVDGYAVHWYLDEYVNAKAVDELLKKTPELELYTTEMSVDDGGVQIGAWSRAEIYATRMIDEVNHGSSAFIDWNFALDAKTGGPTWRKNFLDALILVDIPNNRFFKQPSYHAMGHFSKWIPRGSFRVQADELTRSETGSAAFLRPDGHIAVVIHNSHEHIVGATITDEEKGAISIYLSPKSITTVVY